MTPPRPLGRPLPSLALVLAAGVLLAGCSTVRDNAGPCQTVPALKAEDRPKPPVSEEEQLWRPGHWEWNGSSYTWRAGEWIKRGTIASTEWWHGHWTRDTVPGPCRWVPAHWGT